jgi:hypothetical protein
MSEQGFPPRVILMGAQKAGTTQLASYLEQHPEIILSSPKEPDFYTRHWEQGLDWYKTRFTVLSKILIDASTSYSCAPLDKHFAADINAKSAYRDIPQRIKSVSADAKFIYIMRDPVKRAHSAYLHQVRAGLEPQPFEQAVKRNTYYLRTGHYAGQIELYLQHFDIDRFKFLFFEDFISKPHTLVAECFKFMGLDDAITLNDHVSRNQSFVYKGKWDKLNILLRKKGGVNKLVKTIKPLIPRTFLHKAAEVMTEKPTEMTQQQKDFLTEFYQQPNEQLKQLLGLAKLPWEK